MKKVSIIFLFLLFSVSNLIPNVKPIDRSEIKCGTFAEKDKLKKIYNRIQSPIDKRPVLSFSYSSPSGFFTIHYDTTGDNAVSTKDSNSNGTPDYVEETAIIFDSVYKVEVIEIGYRTPPIDSGLGGNNAYDIYLMNIGNGDPAYYGITKKDFQIKIDSKFPIYATHMILDNDYGPFDSTDSFEGKVQTFTLFGIPSVKITAAHEFHHVIQMVYGDDEFANNHIINEMSSTWMEYRIFPEIKDYIQYVNALFYSPGNFPFGAGTSDHGYKWAIFGQYLFKHFGDKALLRTWELIGEGMNSYLALDSAIEECGSNLTESWCDFTSWLYYTNEKAIEGQYFNDAKIFPDFKPTTVSNFIDPGFITPGITQSFEMRSVRLILPPQQNTSLDTFDIFVANTDLYAASKQIKSNKNYTIIYSNSQAKGGNEIENSGYYYLIDAPAGNICTKAFFVISKPVDYAFPNPFEPQKHKLINLPVPEKATLNKEVIIRLFAVDMVEILCKKALVTSMNDFQTGKYTKRIVQIESQDLIDFQSGVYIYSVEFGEDIIFGKFTIKK